MCVYIQTEIERERDRERDTKRDTESETQRDIQRDRERDRERDTQRETHRERHREKHRERHRERDTERDRYKERDREKDTERERQRERHRETDTRRETCVCVSGARITGNKIVFVCHYLSTMFRLMVALKKCVTAATKGCSASDRKVFGLLTSSTDAAFQQTCVPSQFAEPSCDPTFAKNDCMEHIDLMASQSTVYQSQVCR